MSTSESTPLAVIYAAKSTADPRGSISTQLADCRTAAEAEGREVVGEYHDEAASAFSGNRGAGLTAAKDHAVRTGAELWVQHSDRLARGDGITADHLAEVWFALRRHGVRLRSVQDDSNLDDAIRVVLIGERNHEDSARKSEATRAGMRRRRAKGMHNGGPRKFGYDYVRDAYGRTVPDEPFAVVPAEAVVIERIFRDYVAGVSQQGVQRALNREGITTARGKSWHQGTIAHILADPWYAGLVRADDGGLIPGQHEAIIDRELWERAARIREDSRKSFHRGGRPPARPYLFMNGHLRCGRCGGAMVPRTGTQRHGPDGKPWGRRYQVYQCLTRVRDVTACEQRPIPREAIDQAALSTLMARGVSVEQTRAQMAEALAIERRSVEARLAEAERQEACARDRLARIDRDYADGALSAANYERLYATLSTELDAAEAQRGQLAQHAEATRSAAVEADEAVIAAMAELREAIARHLADGANVDEVRFMLRRLFARFVVRADGDALVLVPELQADAVDELAPGIQVTNRSALRLTSDENGLTR